MTDFVLAILIDTQTNMLKNVYLYIHVYSKYGMLLIYYSNEYRTIYLFYKLENSF